MIPLLLFNICTTEPGFNFQGLKNTIDFRIKNILPIIQIIFDFPFKISAIFGKHDLRTHCVWFVFEFSSLHIPLFGALFYIKYQIIRGFIR